MQKCGKILKRYFRPRGFNIAGASAPVAPAVPMPLVRPLLSAPVDRSRITEVSQMPKHIINEC